VHGLWKPSDREEKAPRQSERRRVAVNVMIAMLRKFNQKAEKLKK
jgi:hypothetical protein